MGIDGGSHTSLALGGKGQSLTYDFFIACAIFIFALTVIMGYWYYNSVQMADIEIKNQQSNAVFLASDIWFKEGFPQFWNSTNVVELGLSNNGVINQTKVSSLVAMGKQKLTSTLSLGMMSVQYSVYNMSGSLIFQFPSAGPASSAQNIFSLERVGIWNDSAVKIKTVIWE
jgi:hypothetical protein